MEGSQECPILSIIIYPSVLASCYNSSCMTMPSLVSPSGSYYTKNITACSHSMGGMEKDHELSQSLSVINIYT